MAQNDKILQTIPEHDTTVSTERVQPSITPEAVTVPSKRPRRKLPWILASAIVLVATAGTVFAYAVLNRPEAILSDAFNKLLTSDTTVFDGHVSLTAKKQGSALYQASFNLQSNQDMNALTAQIGGGSLPSGTSIEGSAVSTKTGDLYLKVANLRQVVTSLMQGQDKDMANMAELFLSPFMSVLDGKWLKLTNNDFKTMSDGDNCTFVAVKLDDSTQQQIEKIFQQHMPVTIQVLGDQTIAGIANDHYRLVPNAAEAKQFVDAVLKLDAFKPLAKCRDQNKTLTQQLSSTPTVDVWINKSSHEPTQLEVQYEDDAIALDTKSTVQLNTSVKSQTPTTNIIPFKDLQNTLLQSFGASLDGANGHLQA